MEASLLGPVEKKPGPFPTLQGEATLLGEEDRTSGASGSAPKQVKSPRFTAPAEQTTALITSITSHCHRSLKRQKSWEVIDIDPNNTGLWISAHIKKDGWFPVWWEEFQPLPNFADQCCRDTQSKYLAYQQAVTFHLPATQKAVHSTWLTPPSLIELRRKEYLGPKDPQLTHN